MRTPPKSTATVLRQNAQHLLTWQYGDGFESPEHSESPEAGKVAHLDERREVAG